MGTRRLRVLKQRRLARLLAVRRIERVMLPVDPTTKPISRLQ